MDDEAPFPNWNDVATKGDVMRALVRIRSATTKLAGAVIADAAGRDAQFTEAFQAYLEAEKKLDEFLQKLGGALEDVD